MEFSEQLKVQFHKKMIDLYSIVGQETGYWAKRYIQKVKNDGGLAAAKSWLKPRNTSLSGLQKLADMTRLDLSFETMVLQEPWLQLFTEQELAVARQRLNMTAGTVLPEEVSFIFLEGAKQQITINVYERNIEARRKCVAHYGPICSVCEVDLKDRYGEVADGFIHVHHLKPLHTIGVSYEVDPIKDLMPVCPNCHAIIHLGGQMRTIEEVRAMLK